MKPRPSPYLLELSVVTIPHAGPAVALESGPPKIDYDNQFATSFFCTALFVIASVFFDLRSVLRARVPAGQGRTVLGRDAIPSGRNKPAGGDPKASPAAPGSALSRAPPFLVVYVVVIVVATSSSWSSSLRRRRRYVVVVVVVVHCGRRSGERSLRESWTPKVCVMK